MVTPEIINFVKLFSVDQMLDLFSFLQLHFQGIKGIPLKLKVLGGNFMITPKSITPNMFISLNNTLNILIV